MKSGLAALAQKRKLDKDDSSEEAEISPRRPIAAPLKTIRVVVVQCQKECMGQNGNLPLATVRIK